MLSGSAYFRDAGIEEAIAEGLKLVLRDRPADPVATLSMYLETLERPSVVLVADVKAELGEAPIWDARHGRLLFLDVLHAKIFSYSCETGATETVDVSQHTPVVSTIVPVRGVEWDDAVVIGTQDGIALFDLEDGTFEDHPSSGSLHARPHTRMNDGRCDASGRLWIGSIARDGPGGADLVSGGAALWLLPSWSATPQQALSDVTVSNGMAWSSDGKTMWYTDSPTFGVDAFDFDDAAGNEPAKLLNNRRRAIQVCAGFPPVPDGCALDVQGKLWVACFGAGEVRRYDPADGRLLCTFAMPAEAGPETTACAFGGEALDELYVTTAHEFWPASKCAEFPLAGSMFKVTRQAIAAKCGPGVAGQPVHYFNCGVLRDVAE